MSTTRRLKLTIGAVSVCLVACGAFLAQNYRQGDHTAVQLKVTDRQQALVSELVEQTESLVAGVGREEALAARSALGETITSFDEGLGALLAGGAVRLDGRAHRVARVDNARARSALEAASQVWTDTGVPLGDLAAGQFSPYSAAGQEAIAGLQSHREELSKHMADAAHSLRQGAAAPGAPATPATGDRYRMSSGNFRTTSPSPATQRRPPETTENCGPTRAATSAASASPIRGPLVTTSVWMDVRRPRSASGVSNWRIELRRTALKTSAAPANARKWSSSTC